MLVFLAGAVIIAAIVIIILYFTGNLPNTPPWVIKQVDVDSLSLDDLNSSCPKMEKITEKLGEPSKYRELFSESEREKLEAIRRACQDVKKSP